MLLQIVDANNFPHRLLITNTQVSKFRKAFENGLSATIKLSETQLQKIGQSGGFLYRHLGPLLKIRLPLMENVFTPLTKSDLIPLRLTAAASATDAAIRKKMFGLGVRPSDLTSRTTLIISNEKVNDIMKVIKYLKESLKESLKKSLYGISEEIKNEAKKQKGWFVGMLLDNLGASLLENLLIGKGTITAGKDTIIAGQDF